MDLHTQAILEKAKAQLRELEDQVRKKKHFVNELCELEGISIMYPDADSQKSKGVFAIRADLYYGRPLATAVREYLEMRQAANMGAAALEDIFNALTTGGFDFEIKDTETAKRGVAISLAKNIAVFHRLPNGFFGLASWYDLDRQPPKSSAKKTRKSKKTKSKVKASERTAPLKTEPKEPSQTNKSTASTLGHANTEFEDKILKVIEGKFPGEFTTKEFRAAIDESIPELAGHKSEVSFALSGLLHRKKLKRIQKGAGQTPGIYSRV